MRDFWFLQGGHFDDYPKASAEPEIVSRILSGIQPAVRLYLVGLALGSYFVLCSHGDSSHFGKQDTPISSGSPLYVDMPRPPHPRAHQRRRQMTNNRNDRNGRNGRNPPARSPEGVYPILSLSYRRAETISRNLIRLLRHVPRRGEDNLPLNLPE